MITDVSEDDAINLALVVGVPVAVIGFLLLCAIVVFVVWKWKHRRVSSPTDVTSRMYM